MVPVTAISDRTIAVITSHVANPAIGLFVGRALLFGGCANGAFASALDCSVSGPSDRPRRGMQCSRIAVGEDGPKGRWTVVPGLLVMRPVITGRAIRALLRRAILRITTQSGYGDRGGAGLTDQRRCRLNGGWCKVRRSRHRGKCPTLEIGVHRCQWYYTLLIHLTAGLV